MWISKSKPCLQVKTLKNTFFTNKNNGLKFNLYLGNSHLKGTSLIMALITEFVDFMRIMGVLDLRLVSRFWSMQNTALCLINLKLECTSFYITICNHLKDLK